MQIPIQGVVEIDFSPTPGESLAGAEQRALAHAKQWLESLVLSRIFTDRVLPSFVPSVTTITLELEEIIKEQDVRSLQETKAPSSSSADLAPDKAGSSSHRAA